MKEDVMFMRLALQLAKKGAGWVNPNPMVGAVIVKDNEIIGRGYHEYFGGPHAEVNALKSCKKNPRRATLYVNLEPCVHHGKTPPCADLILENDIRRVVIAMTDPNPIVNGKGIAYLSAQGVDVTVGVLEAEARKLNEAFVRFILTRKPFCLFKGAMSLDGKIATFTGDSRWISSESSRKMVHQLRHDYAAIMVGIGTVLMDNPTLDARRSRKISKDPLKIVVDSRARISLDANILKKNPQLLILAVTKQADQQKLTELRRMGVQVVVCPDKGEQVDLEYLMLALGSMDISSVLLEGGGTLAFSAVRDHLVDKLLFFIAPKLLGGKKSPTILEGDGVRRVSEAIPLQSLTIKPSGEEFIAEGYLSCSPVS